MNMTRYDRQSLTVDPLLRLLAALYGMFPLYLYGPVRSCFMITIEPNLANENQIILCIDSQFRVRAVAVARM